MPDSHLESLYQEAQAALKARDYEYACELLKRILAVDEDYKDTSHLLAKTVMLRKRRWYNDPRLWGVFGAIVVVVLGFVIAPRIGDIFASPAPTNTASPTSKITATSKVTPTLTLTPTYTPRPVPTDTPDLKVVNPENQHLYLYVKMPTTWHKAKDYCASHGGHLVTITSLSENTFVYKLATSIGYGGRAWLGATDETKEGTWVWVTGESWEYTNWHKNEPANYYLGDDYLAFSFFDRTWMVQIPPYGKPPGFICEWEPGSN